MKNFKGGKKKWTAPEEERERIIDLSAKLFAEICRISNTKAYLSESAAKVTIELALSLSKQEEGMPQKRIRFDWRERRWRNVRKRRRG